MAMYVGYVDFVDCRPIMYVCGDVWMAYLEKLENLKTYHYID